MNNLDNLKALIKTYREVDDFNLQMVTLNTIIETLDGRKLPYKPIDVNETIFRLFNSIKEEDVKSANYYVGVLKSYYHFNELKWWELGKVPTEFVLPKGNV